MSLLLANPPPQEMLLRENYEEIYAASVIV